MDTHTEPGALPQGLPRFNIKEHERSDVAVKWVFGFMLAFFAGGMLIHFIIAWQLNHLRNQRTDSDPWTRSERPKMAAGHSYPRLQLSPPADMESFRLEQDARLHSYGWVNRTTGVVRIPIELAMELLLEKEARQGTTERKPGVSNLQLQEQRPLKREQPQKSP